MSEQPTVRSLHNEAMKHAMNGAARYARRGGLSRDEFDTMVADYHAAWDLENQAISVLMESGYDAEQRQTTERILRRSAVSCLYTALVAVHERETADD